MAGKGSVPWWRVAPAVLWAGALAVSYYSVVQGTTVRASELASECRSRHLHPAAGRTFLYDVHADPVQIKRGGPRTAATGSYDLYLGESDGWIAVYDVAAHRTVREPQGRHRAALHPAERSVVALSLREVSIGTDTTRFDAPFLTEPGPVPVGAIASAPSTITVHHTNRQCRRDRCL